MKVSNDLPSLNDIDLNTVHTVPQDLLPTVATCGHKQKNTRYICSF